jgi:hypothetical protein
VDLYEKLGEDCILGLMRGATTSTVATESLNDIVNRLGYLPGEVRERISATSPSKDFAEIGMDIILGLQQGINNFRDRAIDALRYVGTAMMSGFQLAVAVVSGYMDWLGAEITHKLEAFRDPERAVGRSLGEAIGMGIREGIVSWIGAIIQAAVDAVNQAIAAARAAAQTSSPSKKTMKIGRDLMKGLEVGIQQGSATMGASLATNTMKPLTGIVGPSGASSGGGQGSITIVVKDNVVANDRSIKELADAVANAIMRGHGQRYSFSYRK